MRYEYSTKVVDLEKVNVECNSMGQQGWELAKLALQFSVANPNFASCIAGSADPVRVAQWCDWVNEPVDHEAIAEVRRRLALIHNWFYCEGRPENNDTPVC